MQAKLQGLQRCAPVSCDMGMRLRAQASALAAFSIAGTSSTATAVGRLSVHGSRLRRLPDSVHGKHAYSFSHAGCWPSARTDAVFLEQDVVGGGPRAK